MTWILIYILVTFAIGGVIQTVREELEWRRHAQACPGCPECDEDVP